MIITEPQDALVPWLCSRIHYVPTKNMVVFGIWSVSKQTVIGAIGYDCWSGTSVEMHVYGEGNWATKETMYKAFYYPFIVAGVDLVMARVGSDNETALKFNKRLGFKEQCRIKGAWDGGFDLVILALKKEDCYWLKFDQRKQPTEVDSDGKEERPESTELRTNS